MRKTSILNLPIGRVAILILGLLAVGGAPAVSSESEGPPSLSLDEAIRLAFDRSPALKARKAELSQVEAELIGARTYPFNPELEVGSGDRQGPDTSSTDYEILLTQEIEIAAQRRKRISVGESSFAAAENTFHREQRRLAFEVELAFAEVLAWRELMEISEVDADLTRGLLDFATRRLEAGAGTQVALNLARATAGRSEKRLQQSVSAFKAGGHRLGEVIGLPPELRVEPLGQLTMRARDMPPLEELVEQALVARADLIANRHEMEAAENAIRLAKSLAFPNLKVGLFYAEEEGTDRIKGLGLQLPIPLFNRNQGEIARAQATSERQVAETSAAELAVRREVADAHAAYLAARDSAAALGYLVVGTFEENLSFLQRALEAGKIDAAEVLVFRREFVESQREYVEVLFDAWAAAISLDLATGSTPVPVPFHEETSP